METAPVNTPQEPMFALCQGGCGRLVPTKNGRKHCTDHCRLQAWARRQVAPGQGRIEFAPMASGNETKKGRRREAMLARLRQGPATTFDLMMIGGAGFSSRLAELRRDGHNIPAPEMGENGGVYCLIEEKP